MVRSYWVAFAGLCLAAVNVWSATPVAGDRYGFEIIPLIQGDYVLDDGTHGLELQLTLSSRAKVSLYDLRIYLVRAGSVTLLPSCEPASVPRLDPGRDRIDTWTFNCLAGTAPAHGTEFEFRIEAVDTATQQIVSFSTTSRERS